jgi:hypothetical protein
VHVHQGPPRTGVGEYGGAPVCCAHTGSKHSAATSRRYAATATAWFSAATTAWRPVGLAKKCPDYIAGLFFILGRLFCTESALQNDGNARREMVLLEIHPTKSPRI